MLYCCASEQTKWNHVSTAGVVFVPSPKLVQKGFTRIWFNSFFQDSFLVRRIVLLRTTCFQVHLWLFVKQTSYLGYSSATVFEGG